MAQKHRAMRIDTEKVSYEIFLVARFYREKISFIQSDFSLVELRLCKQHGHRTHNAYETLLRVETTVVSFGV